MDVADPAQRLRQDGDEYAPSTTPHSERTPPSTGISRKLIDLSTVKLCTL